MRYFDFGESDTVRAIYAFDGPTWEDKEVPPSRSEITVVVRSGPEMIARPWQQAWRRDLGSVTTLEAPWHGYSLVELVGDAVLVAVGSELVAFAAQTGEEVWRTLLGPTPICELLVFGKTIVVRSEYPVKGDAVHLVGVEYGGAVLWEAKDPKGSVFANPLVRNGAFFDVTTFNGTKYTVEPNTGELTMKGWTK
ncbi:MAG: PQQ-binding-like beta-propeller repeat protein [Bacteroidota bacterium]